MPSGAELLELVELLAHAREAHRRTGHLLDAQGRAAARVAVELRQHHARQPQPVVERLGSPDGVLADHRVDDEEHALRAHRVLDVVKLLHERVVDRETPGRVVDDDVVLAGAARLRERLRADLERRRAGHVEHRDADLLAEDLELLDGGRALHVGRDEERVVPLFL